LTLNSSQNYADKENKSLNPGGIACVVFIAISDVFIGGYIVCCADIKFGYVFCIIDIGVLIISFCVLDIVLL